MSKLVETCRYCSDAASLLEKQHLLQCLRDSLAVEYFEQLGPLLASSALSTFKPNGRAFALPPTPVPIPPEIARFLLAHPSEVEQLEAYVKEKEQLLIDFEIKITSATQIGIKFYYPEDTPYPHIA